MSKKSSGGARGAMIALCIVLGIILTALLVITISPSYLLGLMERVEIGNEETLSQEELDQLLSDETVAPDETNAPVVEDEDIDWGQEEQTPIETGENIVNILLIGQDARPGEVRGRADTTILVTFNKKTKTITLTSFLRDLYVKIPGYMDNKLNSAYAAGGIGLLNETLEVNFGIKVDGNVAVDFSCFPKVIEKLGGVDMELRQDEADYINFQLAFDGVSTTSNLTSGMQHLNGEQALYYSRIRHLDADADFSRTNRQRKVLNALIEQFRNADLITLLGLLRDVLPEITTDMSDADIIDYATELFPMLADCTIVSQRIPADNAYYLATIQGMSCVVADMDAARELMKQTMAD